MNRLHTGAVFALRSVALGGLFSRPHAIAIAARIRRSPTHPSQGATLPSGVPMPQGEARPDWRTARPEMPRLRHARSAAIAATSTPCCSGPADDGTVRLHGRGG